MIVSSNVGLEWVGPFFIIALLAFVLLEIILHRLYKRRRRVDPEVFAELMAMRLGIEMVSYESLESRPDCICRVRVVEKSPERLLECGSSGIQFPGETMEMHPNVMSIPTVSGDGSTFNRIKDDLERIVKRAAKDPAPVLSFQGDVLLLYSAIERPKPLDTSVDLGTPVKAYPPEVGAFLNHLESLETEELKAAVARVEQDQPTFYQTIKDGVNRILFIRSLGYPPGTLTH